MCCLANQNILNEGKLKLGETEEKMEKANILNLLKTEYMHFMMCSVFNNLIKKLETNIFKAQYK